MNRLECAAYSTLLPSTHQTMHASRQAADPNTVELGPPRTISIAEGLVWAKLHSTVFAAHVLETLNPYGCATFKGVVVDLVRTLTAEGTKINAAFGEYATESLDAYLNCGALIDHRCPEMKQTSSAVAVESFPITKNSLPGNPAKNRMATEMDAAIRAPSSDSTSSDGKLKRKGTAPANLGISVSPRPLSKRMRVKSRKLDSCTKLTSEDDPIWFSDGILVDGDCNAPQQAELNPIQGGGSFRDDADDDCCCDVTQQAEDYSLWGRDSFRDNGDDDFGDATHQGVVVKKKSSTFKGVTFSKARHKWMAKAFVHGKTVYFGLYNTEVAAAKAYDKGVVHLLPQKIINFPQDYPFRRRDAARVDDAMRHGGVEKSMYRGVTCVTFNEARHKWHAKAVIGTNIHQLGYHATEVEAAKAYDNGICHLPERKLNFPEDHSVLCSVQVDDVGDATRQEVSVGDYTNFHLAEDYPIRCSVQVDGVGDATRQGGKKKSIYAGVTFSKARQKWLAKAVVDGNTLNLGSHATEVEAARAYDKGICHLLARTLNFPEDYPIRCSDGVQIDFIGAASRQAEDYPIGFSDDATSKVA
mmetsp:Transcript_82189/g.164253  ORF Transcript_82189/g.164253 Transcript_82189/m.164253 type:complete len:584 (+) Transcript_82189:55-1806(+)